MNADKRLRQQVTAILEGNHMDWTEAADGHFGLRFDSAVVHIDLRRWGAQSLIALHSDVLTNISDDIGTCKLLAAINELNADANFARWVLHLSPRVISLEYELLGDHLQEAELMTALATLARCADHQDDLLKERFGGSRAFE